MPKAAKNLVERLFTEQYSSLLAFFQRRVRTKSDAPDLAQEVYLRMLRVNDADAIRNPEGYLYTVASNLAREYAIAERRRGGKVDLEAASAEPSLQSQPSFDGEFDHGVRLSRLPTVLAQLPAKCRAAVVLQYGQDLSYQEIAQRLAVSPHMVKKYLSQALVHCRRRMARLG